jgi:hypothetical protein
LLALRAGADAAIAARLALRAFLAANLTLLRLLDPFGHDGRSGRVSPSWLMLICCPNRGRWRKGEDREVAQHLEPYVAPQ